VTTNRLYSAGTVHAQLANEIGRRIVRGAIPEGAPLPREQELVAQFKVSRQAVREALKVLAAKGLVAPRRRTGTTVLPRALWNLLDPDLLDWHRPEDISAALFSDMIELRRVIEPAAAEIAAARADPDRLSRLKDALDRMADSVDDAVAFFEADADYHSALLAATGNSLFERMEPIIRAILRVTFSLHARSGPNYPLAVRQHTAVYDAIAHGKGPAARHAMESILGTAHSHVTRMYERL
jgi:DNA-binding FadR family transcriptional regulator